MRRSVVCWRDLESHEEVDNSRNPSLREITGSYPSSRRALSLVIVQSRDIIVAANLVSGGSDFLPSARHAVSVTPPSVRASHPGIAFVGGVSPRVPISAVRNSRIGV